MAPGQRPGTPEIGCSWTEGCPCQSAGKRNTLIRRRDLPASMTRRVGCTRGAMNHCTSAQTDDTATGIRSKENGQRDPKPNGVFLRPVSLNARPPVCSRCRAIAERCPDRTKSRDATGPAPISTDLRLCHAAIMKHEMHHLHTKLQVLFSHLVKNTASTPVALGF